MRSVRYAALLAGGYTILAVVYIVVSSRIAAQMSASVEVMRRIETLKGVWYVVITAAGVFAGAWALLRRLETIESALLARERALLANERRVFAGVLAASIAHDANNVLTALLADLESLGTRTGGESAEMRQARAAADRLVALNRRLMGTVRPVRGPREEVIDLSAEVRELVAALRTLPVVRGCHVSVAGPAQLPRVCVRALLQPIVSNLVLNAAEATSGRGRLEVRLRSNDAGAAIEVHDDGPGIDSARLDTIFQAFVTTKPDGNGLGLFSVKACTDALGGRASAGRSPLGGACFTIELPGAPSPAAADARAVAVS